MTMTQLIALNTASMGGYFVRKEISCCSTTKFLPVALRNIKLKAVENEFGPLNQCQPYRTVYLTALAMQVCQLSQGKTQFPILFPVWYLNF